VKLQEATVTLAHGAGGKATRALVEQVLLPELDNPLLAPLADAALVDVGGTRIAFTTDTFVVRPLFFPGGDIGSLAVNGTINDLAVCGAQPLALSAGLVIEEGFPIDDLRRVAASLAQAAAAAGVVVATGDTKVVERGSADGLFVNTSGLGVVAPGVELGPERVRPGDRVVVSGPIGDHGIAVLAARGDLKLELDLVSDCAPLWRTAKRLLELGDAVRVMRDPTRGGLATTLNELAVGVSIVLDEDALPVRPAVRGACEILGLDPLYIANEGKLVAIVAPEAAAAARAALGRRAAIVGEVRAEDPGLVLLDTAVGGTRVVDMLVGDPLPRIC
jgi:hydrogenase expression/formation protein HypE